MAEVQAQPSVSLEVTQWKLNGRDASMGSRTQFNGRPLSLIYEPEWMHSGVSISLVTSLPLHRLAVVFATWVVLQGTSSGALAKSPV